MGYAVHLLTDAVLEGLVVGQPVVAGVVIRLDLGAGLDLIQHEALQSLRVRPSHHGGADGVGVAVLGAQHSML